jgi:23S rRNA (adenine2503-C2)-methyltransferase
VTAGPPLDTGVLALDRSGLGAWLADAGQPHFRTGQLIRWLYQRGAASYEDMTDLPAGLRETLAGLLPLRRPHLEAREVSKFDGTRRYVWRLADGATVESVGLPAENRLTVCFSTQAGCAMGCSFCATGAGGLVRDLGAGEIAEQVRLVGEDFGVRVTNAVAMGQGEPFANYDATIGGIRLMNDPDGLGIGARHITVSTCGLIAGIERFASEPEQFTLAVSLHSAIQSTRDQLMPALRTQALPLLRNALERYAESTGRRPSLEYALVDGLNDSAGELAALIGFCAGLLCHVNLIPVNPVGECGHGRPESGRVQAFLGGLTEAGIQATVRTERGTDIEAACGQLTQRHARGE